MEVYLPNSTNIGNSVFRPSNNSEHNTTLLESVLDLENTVRSLEEVLSRVTFASRLEICASTDNEVCCSFLVNVFFPLRHRTQERTTAPMAGAEEPPLQLEEQPKLRKKRKRKPTIDVGV